MGLCSIPTLFTEPDGRLDLACGHSLQAFPVEDRLKNTKLKILEDKGSFYFLSQVSFHFEIFSPLYWTSQEAQFIPFKMLFFFSALCLSLEKVLRRVYLFIWKIAQARWKDRGREKSRLPEGLHPGPQDCDRSRAELCDEVFHPELSSLHWGAGEVPSCSSQICLVCFNCS